MASSDLAGSDLLLSSNIYSTWRRVTIRVLWFLPDIARPPASESSLGHNRNFENSAGKKDLPLFALIWSKDAQIRNGAALRHMCQGMPFIELWLALSATFLSQRWHSSSFLLAPEKSSLLVTYFSSCTQQRVSSYQCLDSAMTRIVVISAQIYPHHYYHLAFWIWMHWHLNANAKQISAQSIY